MGTVVALRCRSCGKEREPAAVAACSDCFNLLEPAYDWDRVRAGLTLAALAARPQNIWRYRELLPVDGVPAVGHGTGFTPLLPARRLGERIGIRDLWIKYDAACHPTLSFKDRVASVAVSKAVELGIEVVGCASTGNLANATAAAAAAAGLRSVVLVPEDLEHAKIAGSAVYGTTLVGVRGNYDRVNRLCAEIADTYGWGFLNVNLRPFYGEGSKTLGYEIAEQAGWRLPGHVVSPMAGASLITKVEKAFRELIRLGLVEERPFAVHGAQAAGCAPVVAAFKTGSSQIRPVKPNTIVKSLAIGDPADGPYALQVLQRTGGRAEAADDSEVLAGMRLLAETEGLFAETAGGTVVAAARKLADAGAFADGQPVVLLITGHGLKTVDALRGQPSFAAVIDGQLDQFDAFWKKSEAAA